LSVRLPSTDRDPLSTDRTTPNPNPFLHRYTTPHQWAATILSVLYKKDLIFIFSTLRCMINQSTELCLLDNFHRIFLLQAVEF
jgi:hypothetical protein